MTEATDQGTSLIAAMDTEKGTQDFVTVTIGDQWFGIPVLTVRDVLGPQRITRIPLAPPEVSGALNLRGRIVTAIGVRQRLGLPERDSEEESMSIVVDHRGELYSLIVDSVGEVLSLAMSNYERNPSTLDALWRDISSGVFRLDGRLLLVLNAERLLDIRSAQAA